MYMYNSICHLTESSVVMGCGEGSSDCFPVTILRTPSIVEQRRLRADQTQGGGGKEWVGGGGGGFSVGSVLLPAQVTPTTAINMVGPAPGQFLNTCRY